MATKMATRTATTALEARFKHMSVQDENCEGEHTDSKHTSKVSTLPAAQKTALGGMVDDCVGCNNTSSGQKPTIRTPQVYFLQTAKHT